MVTESIFTALLVACAVALPPTLVWVMWWDSQLKCFHWRTTETARGDETVHTCARCGASKVTRSDADYGGWDQAIEVEVSGWRKS